MLMMWVACRTDKKLLKKFLALPGDVDAVAVGSAMRQKQLICQSIEPQQLTLL